MGTNLTSEEIMEQMGLVVDKVLNNLKSWDGGLESGIKTVEDSDNCFNELKTLSLLLKEETITYEEEYVQKMNLLVFENEKLISGLKIQQEELLVLVQQLSKKEDVIQSYISVKKDSIFIDKDIK